MTSLKSPCRTSYRLSIENIALNCLVFEKMAFLYAFWRQTDGQTDEQMDNPDMLRRSRCRQRRLNKPPINSSKLNDVPPNGISISLNSYLYLIHYYAVIRTAV